MKRRTFSGIFTGPIFGVEDLGWGDIVLALVLSALAIIAVTHGMHEGHRLDAGVTGALAVLLMTAPVAFARRSTIIVAAVMAVGTLLNWGLIGHYVRCGATLPAAFYVAFVVGSRCKGSERYIG